jgi:sugar/nucleoside kinase (ribokinase family)
MRECGLSSPDRGLDLIVVGDCNPDLIVTGDDVTPVFGQAEKLVAGMSLVIGGSASITAVAAARLGLRVALVAAIGDDPAGEVILSLLSREGVDISAVAIRRGLPTGMTAVLSRGADRAILTALGAITTVTAADVPDGLLTRARHLHVSGYFLLSESLGPGLAGLFAAARRRGLSTSLDTNYDPARRWGDRRLRAALAQVDVFLPNEAEARGISGERELGRAAAALAETGRNVVVKLGARGALCVPVVPVVPDAPAGQPTPTVPTAQAAHTVPAGHWLVAVPRLQPVDTTGAGDCFNAGVIMGLLHDLDLPHAVALGCAVGAASTAAPGGTGARIDRQTALRLADAATITMLQLRAGQEDDLRGMDLRGLVEQGREGAGDGCGV